MISDGTALVSLCLLAGLATGRLLRERLVPQRLVTVASLPRNAMGKTMKPDVKALFSVSASRSD